MIQTENNTETITCDKCGCSDSQPLPIAGKVFYQKGWTVNPRAKKYIHKCYTCKSKKQRDAHDFIKRKFY